MITLLADTSINGQDALNLVIELVIAGLIFWLILWFIGWVGLPEPFLKVAKVILGLVVLIFLINILMGFSGHPLIHWR
jgi:ABC-type multidrug transport system permease subunit